MYVYYFPQGEVCNDVYACDDLLWLTCESGRCSCELSSHTPTNWTQFILQRWDYSKVDAMPQTCISRKYKTIITRNFVFFNARTASKLHKTLLFGICFSTILFKIFNLSILQLICITLLPC